METEPRAGERFGAVADAFRQIFEDPGEDAAAVTVLHHGSKVADLWAGTDRFNQRPMPRDGLMVVASCSKGITATILAMLRARHAAAMRPESSEPQKFFVSIQNTSWKYRQRTGLASSSGTR